MNFLKLLLVIFVFLAFCFFAFTQVQDRREEALDQRIAFLEIELEGAANALKEQVSRTSLMDFATELKKLYPDDTEKIDVLVANVLNAKAVKEMVEDIEETTDSENEEIQETE